MKMKKELIFNNTYKKGAVNYLVFQEENKFVGVCLEFDLEVSANTPQEARERIEDYSKAWLENVIKNKLPEELLNKPADKKYWNIYKEAVRDAERRLKAQRYSSSVTVTNPLLFSFYQPYSSPFAFT